MTIDTSTRALDLGADRPSTCPTCGQVTMPHKQMLPPIKRRIVEIVRRRPGISAEDLRGHVWADDPDGGPENAHTLHVHLHQLNKRIAPLGFAVRADHKGAGAGFYLQRIAL